MNTRRVVGLLLFIVGAVIILWGGLFWTNRDTLIDAGGLKVTTSEREGVALPPILGGAAILVGAVLVLLPRRART